MIIANGTIEERLGQAASIDPQTGFPAKPEGWTWGDPVPCQWLQSAHDRLAKSASGSPETLQTYTVLIEQRGGFRPLYVRLKDRYGETIGEFPVKRQEELDAVCESRLYL